MPKPTLAELRTARAILRKENLVSEPLELRIKELESQAEPEYLVSFDGGGGFILTHKSGFPRYTKCPCCEGTILSIEMAMRIVDNLVNGPMDGLLCKE